MIDLDGFAGPVKQRELQERGSELREVRLYRGKPEIIVHDPGQIANR
jgi:hypothetical protein